MPLVRFIDPVPDGSAVAISGGRVTITAGGNTPDPPFFVLFQPGNVLFEVTELPWHWQGQATSIQILTTAAGSNIPEGARHWTVDTEVEHQTHLGFGVLEQYGQDYPANLSDEPPHLQETAERLAEAGITWGAVNYVPAVRSDADYYQAYFDDGAPSLSSSPHGTAWRDHRMWPCDTGAPQYFFSFLQMKMAALYAHKAAVEALGEDFHWYLKFSQYDDTQTANSGKPSNAFILSDFPDRRAEIDLAVFNWIRDNHAPVYPPDAVDFINEMGFDNRYNVDATEARDGILASRVALMGDGHLEPIWFVTSYQDPDLYTAARIDNLWNANGGVLRGKLQFSTHMYGAGGTGPGDRAALANIASIVASRGGSFIDTECVFTPLKCLTEFSRGLCAGLMYFGAVIGINSFNDLFFLDKTQPVGSQVSDQANTKANRLIWQAIRPGYIRVDTPRHNMVDTDDCESVLYRNPVNGKYSGVAVVGTAGEAWQQLPAGTWRLRKVLFTCTNPFSKKSITVHSTDYVGATYEIASGQALHLNGVDNNATGIFSFIQE